MTKFSSFGRGGIGRQVYIAYLLGFGFGIGILLFFFSKYLWDFGIVLCAFSIYHMWEYTYYALFRPRELNEDSFLLNHSTEYTIAVCILVLEYFIELFLFPKMKKHYIITIPAFISLIIGQTIRIVSMYTAGTNFNHEIEDYKRNDHKLITTGIYGWMRHPSYVGMFFFM